MGSGGSKSRSTIDTSEQEQGNRPALHLPETTQSLARQRPAGLSSDQRKGPSSSENESDPRPELPISRPPQDRALSPRYTAGPPPARSTGARRWQLSSRQQPQSTDAAGPSSAQAPKRPKRVPVVAKGCVGDGHFLQKSQQCKDPNCTCKLGCQNDICFWCRYWQG